MTSVEGYARPPTRWRLGIGAAVVVVIVALSATVGIGIVRSAAAPREVVAVDEPAEVAAAAVYVHVFGAVGAPGLYVLAEGSRVVDAIAAAGGFAEGADHAGVNLARAVTDGEQLRVPSVGEPPAAEADADAAGGGLVDLNTATETELDTLPRIGPAMAQRIMEWRDANGGFTSVDDLLAVPGIGDKMLQSLRDLVTV